MANPTISSLYSPFPHRCLECTVGASLATQLAGHFAVGGRRELFAFHPPQLASLPVSFGPITTAVHPSTRVTLGIVDNNVGWREWN